MDSTELSKAIAALDPKKKLMPQALAFLRLTAINNKSKKPELLRARADVLQASSLIGAWISTVEEVIDELAKSLPKSAAKQLLASADVTLTKLKSDVSLDNIAAWQKSDNGVKWAARIILRMNYLLGILEKIPDTTSLDGKYKIWICSFSPKSCKYCKAMHGTVVSKGRSFAVAARKAGWKKVYGGLYTCPLHPNCMCKTQSCDKDGNVLNDTNIKDEKEA